MKLSKKIRKMIRRTFEDVAKDVEKSLLDNDEFTDLCWSNFGDAADSLKERYVQLLLDKIFRDYQNDDIEILGSEMFPESQK